MACCDVNCLEAIVVFNTNGCINLLGAGTATDPLMAQVAVSPLADNALSCGPDGLYVSRGAETTTTLTGSNGVFTYTNEAGATTTIDICSVVQANCNSTVVVNADGSATHTDNTGNTTTIPAPPTQTTTTLVINPDGSATYTNELGEVTTLPAASGETTTTLVSNVDGSFTYTNEAGVVTTIPASTGETVTSLTVDGVANTVTYTDEAGTPTTFSIAGVDSTIRDNGNGTVTYTNESGTAVVLDICNIVQTSCPETATTLVINPDGSLTYTNETGNVTTVPANSETVTTLVDNNNGTVTYVSEDGTTTTFDVGAASIMDNSNGTFTFNDGGGNATIIDVCAMVQANCTDSMVVNANGSVTHTSLDGTVTTIPASNETDTTIVDNGDGSFTYTSETGTATVVDFADAGLKGATVTNNNDGTATISDSEGNQIDLDICTIVANNCTDSLVLNADGSLVHTSVDGSVVNVPAPTSSSLTQTAGVITHTGGNGTITQVDLCAAVQAGGCVPTITNNGNFTYTFDDGYGNTSIIDVNEVDLDITNVTVSGSTITFTQQAGGQVVADVCNMVAANCNARLVQNADGTFTHTANDGVTTVIPAITSSALVDNADGTYTHTAGDGTVTVIDTSDAGFGTGSTVVNNNDGTLSLQDAQGNVLALDICAIVEANCNATLVVNADGSLTHTANDGTVTNVPASVGETVTSIVDNNDGTYTYTNEASVPSVIDISGAGLRGAVVSTAANDGTATLTDGEGNAVTIDICAVVEANCADTMVVNADGSVTHTSVDGTATTIPAPAAAVTTTLVDNADGTFTYTSEDATVTTVDFNNSTITNNNDGTFTHNDGQTDTIIDVCAIVTANCSDSLVINADNSITHTAIDGTVTVIPASVGESVTTLVDNADGTHTYTSEDGTATIIDTTDAVSSVVDNADGTVTHSNGNGVDTIIDICGIIENNCNATLVVNADGSLTYTDNAGTVVNVPVQTRSSVTFNNDGTYTHDDGIGGLTVIDVCQCDPEVVAAAPAVAPTAGESTLRVVDAGGDGQADSAWIWDGNQWVQLPLSGAETVTTLVDGGDGTFTYTSEDGTITAIDFESSTLTDNADGTITHVDGAGTVTNIDICDIIGNNCNATLVVNADGSLTHTDNAGTAVNVPVQTRSTLTFNNDGTYTHDDGIGGLTVIDVCQCDPEVVAAAPGVAPAAGESGLRVVDANGDGTAESAWIWDGNQWVEIPTSPTETVTTLVNNADGTSTYTSEDATVTVLPAETTSTLVANADGSYTYTDETGTATAITAETTTTLVVNADGTSTYTSEDGTATVIPAETTTTFTIAADGQSATYTSEDGTVTVVPICNCPTTSTTAGAPAAAPTVATAPAEHYVLDANNKVSEQWIWDGTAWRETEFCCSTTATAAPTAAPVGADPIHIAVDADGDGTAESQWMWDGAQWVEIPIACCVIDWCVQDTNGDQFTAYANVVSGTAGTPVYLDPTGAVGAPVAPLVACSSGGGGGTETITTLVANVDGTFTYTSEDGTTTVITAGETDTTLTVDTTTGVATYTNEAAVVTNFNLCNCPTTSTTAGAPAAAPTPYATLPAEHYVTDGTNVIEQWVWDGTQWVNVVAGGGTETVTTLTESADGTTTTYTSEDGTATVLDNCNCPTTSTTAGAPAAAPGIPTLPAEHYVTDGTNVLQHYVWDGTAWNLAGADAAEVPDSAFADLCNPTQAEVETWVGANGPWAGGTVFAGESVEMGSTIAANGTIMSLHLPEVTKVCGWSAPRRSVFAGPWNNTLQADGSGISIGTEGMVTHITQDANAVAEGREIEQPAGGGRFRVNPGAGDVGWVRMQILEMPDRRRAGMSCEALLVPVLRMHDIDNLDSSWSITFSDDGASGCLISPYDAEGGSGVTLLDGTNNFTGGFPAPYVISANDANVNIGITGASLDVGDWIQWDFDFTNDVNPGRERVGILPLLNVYEPVEVCLAKDGTIISSLDENGATVTAAFTEADC